ncbi:LysR substrate-binding domain-containing protein [Sphingobacterium sp. LRF_L2]|uniref:LysR substrate-binding domain-containing protein n=1 Tax=Sphingobacterium sp. LRF_L2 TaxID=3369421 RepID=UPI003F5E4BA9
MFDFRLKVFYIVATRLNFTKAAKELFISQPAVSKHIQEIETFYKMRLFERNGSKIKLTEAGAILLRNVESLRDVYRKIDVELAALSEEVKGTLKIGVSTTVANYFLPKYLSSFKERYPDVKLVLSIHNTEYVESMLQESKVDIGIVEGQSKRHYLKYTSIARDEIVLCTRNENPNVKKGVINKAELKKLPLVVREMGSGSREVLLAALKSADINFSDLSIDMEITSTEGTKCYLLNSNTFAFLSIHSVFGELKNGDMRVVDVKGLEIQRCFFFVTPQGSSDYLSEIFYKHLLSHRI